MRERRSGYRAFGCLRARADSQWLDCTLYPVQILGSEEMPQSGYSNGEITGWPWISMRRNNVGCYLGDRAFSSPDASSQVPSKTFLVESETRLNLLSTRNDWEKKEDREKKRKYIKAVIRGLGKLFKVVTAMQMWNLQKSAFAKCRKKKR